MTMMSASLNALLAPSLAGRKPVVFLYELNVSQKRAGEGEFKTYGVGGDVRKVRSDTGCVDDIVQCELIDERGELQQQGQGLDNNIISTEAFDSNVQERNCTCPMPPEAPATTIVPNSVRSSESSNRAVSSASTNLL
jgi:hypothetical protein